MKCKVMALPSLCVPVFLHATHFASFVVSYVASIPAVDLSASHTGEVENTLQPSALPDIKPQTLHDPVERHL